jgi:hypothetical protein
MADAEVYIEDACLEIGNEEQRMLLLGELQKVSDLAEVGLIFET